jgi:hypothetical protein
MSHTSRRRTLAAAATALLALAPSALAAPRAPQPGPTNSASRVAAQPGALTGTHAHTPSDFDPAYDANVGAYTPGAIPAVSYPSGGAYTPGAIPAVSYPQPAPSAHAVQVPDSRGGVSRTTIGLGIAGSLLAIAGVVGLARRGRRSRRMQRARVTA